MGETDVESADRQIRHQMIAVINRLRTCLLVPVSEGCMMDNMYSCHHVLTSAPRGGGSTLGQTACIAYRKLVAIN